MSDSASVSSDSLSQLFGETIDQLNQIDTSVRILTAALEKRGLQTTFEIDGPVRVIRHHLIKAQRESENVIGQLKQLQDLVQSSALITSSLQLDQVLEQVMQAVITLTGAERAYLMLQERDSDAL